MPQTLRSWLVSSVCLGASFATQEGASAQTRASRQRDDKPAAVDEATVKRIYADAFTVWIYKSPQRSDVPLGYLRGGQSVALRNPRRWQGNRCPGGWYAVEPAGFVCHERGVSLEATRYNQAMNTLAARSGAYPFDYGVSLGAPAYRRVPRREEVLQAETGSAPRRAVWSDPEMLTSLPIALSPLPWFLEGAGSVSRAEERRLTRRVVPPETLLSVVSRFEVEGLTYYQAADGTVVPADRLRLFRRSSFAGLRLDDSSTLPLGWPRSLTPTQSLTDVCRSKLMPDMPPVEPGRVSEAIAVLPKCFEVTSAKLAPFAPTPLSGHRVSVDGRSLVETRQGGWVAESSLKVALIERPPHILSHEHEKWIHFSIQRGTLVAYEGTTPVFATLASPGSGEPNPNGQARLTPTGTFRIAFKHVADDMSREEGEHRSEWKADVPYAMYFKHPYGIHVSYWHEDFGSPKSGGCINVSPQDGAWLFDWTEPHLPEGWFGVGSSKELGVGTLVHITQ